MSRFVAVDRQTSYLLPPSVDEWLPHASAGVFAGDLWGMLWMAG